MNSARIGSILPFLVPALVALGCGSSSSPATTPGAGGGSTTTSSSSSSSSSSGSTSSSSSSSSSGAGGAAACGPDVAPPNEVLPDTTDPEKGMFTIDQALATLPQGPGPLRAIIDTDLGTLTCTLRPDKAPNGVANFVGLARGVRAWKDAALKKWVRRPLYDGLIFHRVIPKFMAQGGDPLGTGFGGPGYKFADEISDLTHLAGTLAYANSGANTNGSQFYVCEVPYPSLDGGYTIFGQCEPVSVVVAITGVPCDANNKPLTPVHMKTITVTRCAP